MTEEMWTIFRGETPLEGHLSRTRTGAIASFMRVWDQTRTNWRKLKREGFSCRKVTVTIAEGWD